MLVYSLTLLVSFLGILISIMLGNMAIEEIEHARRYLKYLNVLIVPAIVLVATYNINKTYSILFFLILLALLFVLREKYNDAWTYSCMGAILYVSSLGEQMLTVAIMIFIYGMSIGTIRASEHFKKKINGSITFKENISLLKKIFLRYGYYLIIGILFYLTFTYVF